MPENPQRKHLPNRRTRTRVADQPPTAKPLSLGERARRALDDPLHQLQLALFVLAMLIVVGTVGYVWIEGYPWLDALYMTIITVATVGFGEIHPLSQVGRAFTIVLIVLGVGVGAWAFTNAVEVVLGQALWLSMQRRKMSKSIEQLSDHYVVCGYGRLGTRIVHDLRARGEPFVVIERIDTMEEEFVTDRIPHLIGDATHDEVLLRAGVERARGLVAALDSDANNVLTVLSARGLNPDLLVVARANSEESESKLVRAGADRVVTPDSIGGHRLALALLRPAVHDLFNRIFSFRAEDADVGQLIIPEGSPFAGQTIAECGLRRMRNVSILAVRGNNGEFVLNPEARRVIEVGETLILIGPGEAIYELEAMYGE